MGVDAKQVMDLHRQTGCKLIECKKILEDVNGDYNKALEILKKKGLVYAERKMDKVTSQGIIQSYIHSDGKGGVLLELSCETDFVAKNEEFRKLSKDLCLQIYAMEPKYIQPSDVPADILEKEKELYLEEVKDKPPEIRDKIIQGKLEKNFYSKYCLLNQAFIKDETGQTKVADLIKEKISKFGENITVKRFARFELGKYD